MRSYFLTQVALRKLFCEGLLKKQLELLHETVMGNATSSDDPNSDLILAAPSQRVQGVVHEAAATSRTAKLWMIEYYHQITLMCRFIRDERCGHWTLHLGTVREMIPNVHAAGHLAYAKYRPLLTSTSSKCPIGGIR